jgi:ATP synthase (F/14-kDa) subunit.
MKSYCLCEKVETQTAMRLGGIESKLIGSDEEAKDAIEALLEDPSIGLIMISENIHNRLKDMIMDLKLLRKDTLIIQVPEPEGLQDKEYIMKYIKNSIGIKL